MNRRSMIGSLLSLAISTPAKTEKSILKGIFDRAGINWNEFKPDHLSIAIDNTKVIGYNGRAVEFVFEHGRLAQIELFDEEQLKIQKYE